MEPNAWRIVLVYENRIQTYEISQQFGPCELRVLANVLEEEMSHRDGRHDDGSDAPLLLSVTISEQVSEKVDAMEARR